MSLYQGLQQKMLQRLSPQQIQLMKLLQVPTADLEQRIKEELEENPALELAEENEDNKTDELEEIFTAEEEVQDDLTHEEIDIAEYISEGDDEMPDYKTKDDNYAATDEARTIPIKMESSFHEYLIMQLGMLGLNEHEQKVAEQIVGSIDDDGYLRRDATAMIDDMAFRQNIQTTETELQQLIHQIQQFDPPGIAARDLKECLLLQLQRQQAEGKDVTAAIKVLTHHFEAFTKKHYEKIQHSLSLTDDALKQIINQIIRLNPRPGGDAVSGHHVNTSVIPDFFVVNNNGILDLTLNAKNAPDLRISEGYRDMLKEYDKGNKKDKHQKEAVLFIKQKIDSAKWFIDIVKQRQHTLLSTMNAIMQHQKEFFISGDETTLHPMILKDVAERTGLDISTISRVANSKFVQTEFGTHRLKFFFSESMSTDSGEEVSTREVKKILSDVIEAEDKRKPLSDERLTELLQEKGYNIARRTVAKYREQLNVPVARLRKEL
ncbi:MAG TPA: RNA polymerase factor sigma-54 [Chitinophagaceae bacterium]|nr:RNA polymerase factor sigma-54 [Chitinophagaceae bacterium]